MPRNILQDIVPPEKRTIRNIPLPNRPRQEPPRPSPSPRLPEDEDEEPPKVYGFGSGLKPPAISSKRLLWVLGGVVILLAVIVLMSLTAGATVTVTPKQSIIKAESETFTAEKGATEGLSFETVRLSRDSGSSVPATGEEKVERKASGRIVIYNNYDAKEQRLIKNTRFETPEGLIYRINESVVVPGKTLKNGETVPGSVEVTVYADEPGEKYNIGLKDFTIPGFKGDPRYKSMYGRSKTEATGGFIGMVKKVSESDLKTAQETIHEKLRLELEKEVASQIPETVVLYPGAVTISFEPLAQSEARGNSVKVNERGILTAVLLRKDMLAKALAERLAPQLAEGEVEVPNLDRLSFAIADRNFHPERDSKMTFAMNGDVDIVAQFDEEEVKAALTGKSKKDIQALLGNYPAIERAEAVIRPFWKQSFPSNAKRIRIEKVIVEPSVQE
ncbi:hypothetical protein EPN83_02020 [Patescibacteria group bacterium]|nr:MAG: hypothetical protein EPN83_02020 [Patescibacteria group bacterium]